jgi:hypothetical protein
MRELVFAGIGVGWLAMVGMSMLKDRIFTAIAGMVLTATALPLFGSALAILPIGAGLALVVSGGLRLARPDSFWSRRFYDARHVELARRRASGEDATPPAPAPGDLFR